MPFKTAEVEHNGVTVLVGGYFYSGEPATFQAEHMSVLGEDITEDLAEETFLQIEAKAKAVLVAEHQNDMERLKCA